MFPLQRAALLRSLRHWWARPGGWREGVLELFFPPQCLLCESQVSLEATQLCRPCIGNLLQSGPQCARCGSPLPPGGVDTVGPPGCGRCRDRRYAFEHTFALGVYQGAMRAAVLEIKKSHGETLARALGQLLGRNVAERTQGPLDWVVPLPTQVWRRVIRGANPPEWIAEWVALELALPTRRLLRYRRKTRKQGTLSPAERFRNVRGALEVPAPYDLQGRTILLIDDVMTTGATASEAARALRAAGAGQVLVAVLARGVG